MLKDLPNALLRKLGYELRSMDSEVILGGHLRWLFGQLQIDCVLDVGANEGQYVEWLREAVGFGGLVISFEPVEEVFRTLAAKACHDPWWEVYQMALGSERRTGLMNVSRDTSLSSLLLPSDAVVDSYRVHGEVTHQQPVEIARLDEVFDEIRQKYAVRHVYLKMDTQGSDLEVLHGAEATLPSVRALQTELSIRPIYANMPDFVTVYAHLKQKGFDLTGAYPVSRDRFGRVIETDGVFINSRICV